MPSALSNCCTIERRLNVGVELTLETFAATANDLPIAKFCEQIEVEWQELLGTGRASGSEGNDWTPEPLKKEE